MQDRADELPAERASVESQSAVVAWLPLLPIYTVFMLGNILLPSVFWHMARRNWLESLAMFFVGIMTSEIAILGAWMALRNDRWTHRLLGGFFLLAFSTTCYLLGLTLADNHRILRVEVWLGIYFTALMGWCATWLSLAVVRARSGCYISSRRTELQIPGRTQFSISYLLTATAAVALLLAIVKAAMPPMSQFGIAGLLTSLLAGGCFVFYGLMLLVPCCWLTLKKTVEYRWALVLVLELIFLGSLTIECIKLCFNRGPFGARNVALFYEYSLGYVVSLLLVFYLLRRCGFELHVDKSLRSNTLSRRT